MSGMPEGLTHFPIELKLINASSAEKALLPLIKYFVLPSSGDKLMASSDGDNLAILQISCFAQAGEIIYEKITAVLKSDHQPLPVPICQGKFPESFLAHAVGLAPDGVYLLGRIRQNGFIPGPVYLYSSK